MEEQRKERTVEELSAENTALYAEIERLQHEVDLLKKAVFGQRSEKKVLHNTEAPEQLSIFNEAETEARREESEEVTVPEHKRRKKRSRAENAIRPFVVGRKNWLFSDTPKGAAVSAMLYSLVVSAKMNGLNAEEYLVRLFRSAEPVLPYEDIHS